MDAGPFHLPRSPISSPNEPSRKSGGIVSVAIASRRTSRGKKKARRLPDRRAFLPQSTSARPVVVRDYPSQTGPIRGAALQPVPPPSARRRLNVRQPARSTRAIASCFGPVWFGDRSTPRRIVPANAGAVCRRRMGPDASDIRVLTLRPRSARGILAHACLTGSEHVRSVHLSPSGDFQPSLKECSPTTKMCSSGPVRFRPPGRHSNSKPRYDVRGSGILFYLSFAIRNFTHRLEQQLGPGFPGLSIPQDQMVAGAHER